MMFQESPVHIEAWPQRVGKDGAPDYGSFRVHPVLALFPLMADAEFAALVASIADAGLQEKIVLLHDRETIVDGRNRFQACYEARVDPVFRVLPASFTEEQTIRFIVAANLLRQHLTAEQRAAFENAVAGARK